MKEVLIVRAKEYKDKETIGFAFVFENGKKLFEMALLELPFRNNKRNVSCVPVGEYHLVLEYSPKFQMMLWEAKGIPGRSECKFHAANYVHQLNGCFAPGAYHTDLNGDGLPDVSGSYQTLMKFHDVMGRDVKAKLKIIDLY